MSLYLFRSKIGSGSYTQTVEENALPGFVRWRDWSGNGLEHAVLRSKGSYIDVQSVVLSGAQADAFAALYTMRLDSDWRVLEVQASIVGTDRSVCLRRTKEDRWFDRDHKPIPEFDGIADVDLSITPFTNTPFTNTLPIRRLQLANGDSAEIVAVYVAFPDLVISTDRQRYTRIAADLYRYESLDSDFVREITVDRHGLVVTYPGLFRRIE